MNAFALNNGNPVIDLEAINLSVATQYGNPALVDLAALAAYSFGGLIVTARTSNPVSDPSSVVKVNFAFSNEVISPLADAPAELFTRRTWLECFASPGLPGAGAAVRQHASPRQPLHGRYLYLWWSALAGGAGDALDLEVWVNAVD